MKIEKKKKEQKIGKGNQGNEKGRERDRAVRVGVRKYILKKKINVNDTGFVHLEIHGDFHVLRDTKRNKKQKKKKNKE